MEKSRKSVNTVKITVNTVKITQNIHYRVMLTSDCVHKFQLYIPECKYTLSVHGCTVGNIRCNVVINIINWLSSVVMKAIKSHVEISPYNSILRPV